MNKLQGLHAETEEMRSSSTNMERMSINTNPRKGYATLCCLIFLLGIVSKKRAVAQEKEIFIPPNGIVIDFAHTDVDFIIETSVGNYERRAPYQYVRTRKTLDKTNHTESNRMQVDNMGQLVIEHERHFSTHFSEEHVKFNDRNYVGTYHGLLHNGKLIKHPRISYVDGAIRTFNDTTYICYDALGIAYQDSVLAVKTDLKEALVSFDGGETNYGRIQDIHKFEQDYLLLTSKGLFLSNLESITDTIFYTTTPTIDLYGRIVNYLNSSVEGFIGNKYFLYQFVNKTFIVLEETTNPINDINTKENGFILTTTEGIYARKERLKEIIKGEYHGCFKIDGTYYAYSNRGLFRLIKSNNTFIEQLVFKYEFNRFSGRIDKDSLFLGSVGGLWAFPLDNLPKPILEPKVEKSAISLYHILWLIPIVILTYMLARNRANGSKSLNQSEIQNNIISLENIRDYIRLNISSVTILNMRLYFNTSQKSLYDACAPFSPGQLIRDERTKVVKECLKQGYSIKEIADQSGFSKEYLTKTIIPRIKQQDI